MTVSIALAILGGIILIGFLANLFFRLTKLPSVLVLMGLGVFLGPVSGWVTSDALIGIAPFFGTIALLVILFEGGLELDIDVVVRQAPRATLLATIVFFLSFITVAVFTHYLLEMRWLSACLLASILGATSPAICIPVTSGLSVREDIKTLIKLESALGDVLLIVAVVLLMDIHSTGRQDIAGVFVALFLSFVVALIVAGTCGILWSRLVGWLSGELLAYMLTLGFVFLLYFIVEESGGSAALAVFFFAMLLGNMQVLAGRFGGRIGEIFGMDIRAEQFLLGQFMKNITEELSFLVRTFFFVYLGLLLDFKSFDRMTMLAAAGIVLLLVLSRYIGVRTVGIRIANLNNNEKKLILAMLPRGLATAVMAFLVASSGIEGAERFPIYTFFCIVVTNLWMTVGVVTAEHKLLKTRKAIAEAIKEQPSRESTKTLDQEETIGPTSSAVVTSTPKERMENPSQPFPSGIETPDPKIKSLHFTDRIALYLEVSSIERTEEYLRLAKAADLGRPLFWIQLILAILITTLGLVLDQSAIILCAALIVPLLPPVLASGLALASGDIYLAIKLFVKLFMVTILSVGISGLLTKVLPYHIVTSEISTQTQPTVLHFVIALLAGISGTILLKRKNTGLSYVPGALIGVVLVPPLCVMGWAIGSGSASNIIRGSALLFTANGFAGLLGAVIVFTLLGMPRIADHAKILSWKERELAHPFAQLIFKRPKIRNLIGRPGSVRSRILVLLVFGLATIIPLQMALNELTREYRVQQSVRDLQKMFEIPGRSAIVSSSSTVGKQAVSVRLQVATNIFFSATDIQRFEERLSDRAGIPARLVLVQSLSDLGAGDTIQRIFFPKTEEHRTPQNITEAIWSLQPYASQMASEIPLSSKVHLAGIQVGLGTDAKTPLMQLSYLAEESLSADAAEMAIAWIRRYSGLPDRAISLEWIPASLTIALGRDGLLPASSTFQFSELSKLLKRFPAFTAVIELPSGLSTSKSRKIQEMLPLLVPEMAEKERCSTRTSERNTSVLTLRLELLNRKEQIQIRTSDSIELQEVEPVQGKKE